MNKDKKKVKLDLITVRLQRTDLKRIDSKKLKEIKTEPRWSVIERALNELEKKKKRSK